MSALRESEGLRERKKRRTRDAIARAAMELFSASGFDAVTVADVARAADVSEKTVFNYFPTKEDLVLHHAAERLNALIESVRSRRAGASLVEPFRAWTMDLIDQLEHGSFESIVAVPRMAMQSKSLRDRIVLSWEQQASQLTPVIAAEAGEDENDVLPGMIARTLLSTRRMVFRAGFRRLLAGEDRRTVAADLRGQATRAFDLLETGLAGYGVKPR